jgi:pyrroline-5-carboxylate reductase
VVVYVDEELMHDVTALSGKRPRGKDGPLARSLGAAKLLRETMLHPAVLRDHVITPGGVPISAIHELEKHGLRSC